MPEGYEKLLGELRSDPESADRILRLAALLGDRHEENLSEGSEIFSGPLTIRTPRQQDIALLLALRPYLGPKRQELLDKIIGAFQLFLKII